MAIEAATVGGGAAEQAFGPYFHAIKRHWRVVLLVTAAAVALAALTIAHAGAKYSASASVLVTPLPEGDAGFTAAALVDSPNAAAATAKQLGAPWTVQSVSDAVSVTPRGASDVLAVTAQASSTGTAERLANSFATHAVGYRASVVQAEIAASINQLQARLTALRSAADATAEAQTLASGIEQLRAVQGTGREPTLSVSQTAVSATRTGASKTLILLLALIGGFALASVAALALDTFSGPVRDREEIERLFALPVLAAMQEVPGRGGSRSLPPWLLPPVVFEQLRMLRVQLSMLGAEKPVVMVTSAAAGDGKTTVAAGLAAAFAEAGKQVIIMDLDLRKPDLPQLLQAGTAEQNGTEDGMAGFNPAGVPLDVSALPGVRIVQAPKGDVKSFEMLAKRLPALLAQARRAADVVVIDTAPVGEVSEALVVARMCDHVVVVARPRHTNRRRLVLTRDLLQRAGASVVGLVLVGKDVGLPPADQSYAYALQQPSYAGKDRPRPVPTSGLGAEARREQL
jgi:capsular exopolysaccharide synthesis family protein